VTKTAVLVTKPTPTTTVLTLSASSATYGQKVTLTATVSGPSGSATPIGIVSFYDGSTKIGSVALSSSGLATLSKSNFRVGTHTLRARYLGNVLTGASTSAAVTLVVSRR
jgi:hypothetical protein